MLSDELDEDYFQHRHLKLRQQLQQLATQAASSRTPWQQQQQQQVLDVWEERCSAALHTPQLQWLLHAWAAERGRILQTSQQPSMGPRGLQQLVSGWELGIRHHCGSSE